MPPKKAAKVKLTKNEQKEREKELDKKLSQEALPKYLTEGLVMLDKDVLCEGVNLYTPDGKIELVKNARVQLLQGRRYGLIGKNGIGKTTLLNQISGYKLENFPQYLRVMHVRQEANIASDMPVLEYVVKSDELKAYLESEETRVLAAIEEGDLEDADGTDLNVKLEKIYERLEDINARTAEGRARQILLGLQFSDAMIAGPTKALSGGWRVRVSLACALFVQPDILLLDEPTNHLDFPAVDWLISYLKVYTKTCIVVSHDRGFLNNVITDVMDMHDQKLDYYRGDYDSYVKTKDENMKLAQRNYDKQEKERVALKQFIEEAKRSKNRQVADMAASRQARLDKMEVLEPPVFEKPWSFTFPDPGSLDHSLVSLIKVNFGWDPTQPEKLLLKNVDGFVDMKSRVGILGANGAGKTTLINLILGKLKPWSGQLKLNEQARTVLFTQHHMDQLDMSLTPLEYVQKLFPLEKEGRIRGFLGHFGFDQNLIAHKIGTLSGGQKSRVAFAILSWNNPHCIIMDEPTNHLDLQTVEALATSLKTFEGGVILISHDIYFLSEVAETFWAVNGAGEVKEFHELDAAKAFSYKPILYKPLDGMQEETKEVKEAFAAKKAAEAALREAEYKKKMAALDSEIANISVESIAQLEEKGEGGGGGGGGAGGKGKKAKNKEKEAKAPEPEVKAKPKEPEKDAVEQMLAYHFSASTKKLPKKTVSAAPSRPGMDMAKAGFGALNEFSEEEDLMSEEEVEEKEKKKKKKKDKAEEDGEEGGEKEKKKKKKKDKGEDGEEEGEDGEKEKKKKKKKDKGEDEGDEGEGEKEKKKKKKDKGEDEGDEEDGEKEKKKKKKKDKGEDEGDQGEEKEKKKKKKDKEKEGEEEEGGEKEKKKKKKDKEKEGEEEDGGEKEKKKKKKDKEKEGDEEGEEKEKKKKKKDKEKEDEGEGEDGEKKKKKKKKDKEEGEDEGEGGEGEKEKKKKKKDKEKEADAEEDEGAKEKKKKKKEGEDGEVKKEKKEKKPADADDETDAKKDEEEEDGGKKKKKDKKKDKEEDEGAKKKDKKKDKEEGEKKNKDEDDDGKKKKKNKDKREDEEEEADAVKADKEQKKEKGGGKKKNKKNRDDDDEEEAEGPTAEQQPPEEEDADAIERRERLARLDKKAQSKKERSNANPNASPPATDLATAAATAAVIAAEEVKKEDKGNKKGNKGKKGEEEEGPEVKEDKKGKKGKKGDDEEEEAGGKKDKKKGKKKGGDSEEDEEEEQGKKGKKKGKKKGGDSGDEEEEEAQKGGKKKKGGKKGAKESEGEEDEEEDNKKGKKKGKKAQQESEGEEDEEEAKGKGGKKKGGKKAKDAEDDGEEEEEAKGKGGKKKGGKKAKGDAEDEDEEEEQPKKGKKKGGKKGKDESDGEEGTEEQKLTGMVKDLSLEDQPKGKKGKGKADEDGEKKPKSKGH